SRTHATRMPLLLSVRCADYMPLFRCLRQVIVKGLLPIFFAAVTVNAQPQLALKQVASGLNRPVGIVNAGDSRLFIVLQLGQIAIYDGTRVLSTPFLDIRQLVSPGISGQSERGLLGLAFDPRRNGFFYVHYTNTTGDITIERFQVSSSD